MAYEITLEQSLILNFFNSSIYFVFENDEEKDSFLDYIKIYDDRFKNGFNKKEYIKCAMWKFSGITHKHQIEWAEEINYFLIHDAIPVSYSIVKEYIDKFSKINNAMSELFSVLK